MSNEPVVIYLHDRDDFFGENAHRDNTVQWSETSVADDDYQYIRSTTGLFNFFMWFRANGEKYVNLPVEKMIETYLKSIDKNES